MAKVRKPICIVSCLLITSIIAASCGGSSSSGSSNVGKTAPTVTMASGQHPMSSMGGSDSMMGKSLPAKVRIANVVAGSGGKGKAVDVWAGTPQAGKKLATVNYGSISDVLTPLAGKYDVAQEQHGQSVYNYSLTIVPKGSTSVEEGIQQNETAYPGDELTVVVGDSTLDGAKGFSAYVYFTKIKTERDSIIALFSNIKAKSGQRLLMLDTMGIIPPPKDDTKPAPEFDAAVDGKCLPEIGVDGMAPPSSAHTRTMMPINQGAVSFAYEIGEDVTSVDVVGGSSAVPDCGSKPIATIDMGKATGPHSVAMLYGPIDSLKVLTLNP